jgi:PAS domain S-box-containing protein
VSLPGETPSGHGFPQGGVFNAAVDAVIVIASDGFVVDWNPAAERIFGYARDAALGRELADLIVPDEFRPAHRRALLRWRTPDAPTGAILGRRLALTGQRADGSTMDIELTVNRIGAGEPPLFVGFIRDLSGAGTGLPGGESTVTGAP